MSVHAMKRKRGGTSWKVYYYDPDGRQRTKTFRSRTRAYQFDADTKVGRREGGFIDPKKGKLSLREMYDRFLANPPKPLRPSTRAKYETYAKHIVGDPERGRAPDEIASLPINAITPSRVRDFYARLADRGVRQGARLEVHKLLRRVLQTAVLEERIARNPASGLAPPSEGTRGPEPYFMTHEQVLAIADEVPPHYRNFVLFLAYTGLRISEATALRVRHLNPRTRTITVEESSVEISGKKLTGPTKTRRKRAVRIPDFLFEELAPTLSADPNALVFPAPQGGPIRQSIFRWRIFQPAATRASVLRPDGTPPRVHDLRHTAASLAIQAGAHPKVVQEMLGHSTITVTLDIYGHLMPGLHEEVVGRMGAEALQAQAARAAEARSRQVVALEDRQEEGGRAS